MEDLVWEKDYDENQLYFNEYYKINDTLSIRQPTIGEVIEYGELAYYSMVYKLCIHPTLMMSALWDMGKDWTTVDDFQLFISMTRDLTAKDTFPILGKLDLSKMQPRPMSDGKVCLIDKDYFIDELIYTRMVSYIRDVHGFEKHRKKAKTMRTKKLMIQVDRDEIEMAKREGHKGCQLRNLASYALNSAGFKYNKQGLKQCGIVEFFDSIQRLNIIDQSHAALQGAYSGMVDTKKINKKIFDATRALELQKESSMIVPYQG